MSDVLICHSPDNQASARLLADAITGEGYGVALHYAPSEAITGEIAEAKAAIVIWSESASASEWIRAEANVARGLKKLIQLSADGRPPPVPFDRAQMISILTWRGEADHPAWQGIKEALVALCGPAPVRPAPVAPVEPEPEPAPPPVPAPVSAATPRAGPNPLLLVLIVGLVIAALAVGAWFWMQNRAPATVATTNETTPAEPEGPQIIVPETPTETPSEPPPPADTPPPPPAAFDRQAIVRDPAGAAILRNAPSSLGLAMERVESGARVVTYDQQADWWQVRTASGRTGYLPASSLNLATAEAPAPSPAVRTSPAPPPPRTARTERRAPPAPVRRSRIRKENSEVMVQYCDGAGRGTPQCRRFRRDSGY